MARATGSMSWATTRVAPAKRAAMPATPLPQPRSSTVCPADPGGLSLHDAGQQLARRPDGRPEGDRLRRPALLLPRLPQGEHVRGVMGHEVRTPGDRGQRGQPRKQRGRGDRHRPDRRGLYGTTCFRMRASHRQAPLPRVRPAEP
jgi:hypothetical protein